MRRNFRASSLIPLSGVLLLLVASSQAPAQDRRQARLDVDHYTVDAEIDPAQSTLAVFTFLGAWNDYWWPLISATRSDMYTLTVGLAAAQMNYAQTSGLGYLMAQAIFASIPIFIVYIIFQKQIVRAMAGTAVR